MSVRRSIRHLINYYIDNLDPQLLMLTHAIKSTLVGLLCMLVYFVWHLPQPLWLILTGVFVIQAYRGDRLLHRVLGVLLVAVLSVLGVGFFSWLGQWFWGYLVALMMVTFIGFYLRQYGMSVTFASMFCLALFLFAGGMPATSQECWQRVISAGIGATIAVVVAVVVFPYRPRVLLKHTLDSNLTLIREYIDSLFTETLLGKKDYQQTLFFKARVNERLRHARILVSLYPNKVSLDRVRRQLVIFGQLVALHNLFFIPRNSTAFFGLYDKLGQVRDCLLKIIELQESDRQQALLHFDQFLVTFNQKAEEHEDVASLFFYLKSIGKSL